MPRQTLSQSVTHSPEGLLQETLVTCDTFTCTIRQPLFTISFLPSPFSYFFPPPPESSKCLFFSLVEVLKNLKLLPLLGALCGTLWNSSAYEHN